MADLINKVVRFHEFGPAEVLRVESGEVQEPGPGEVRIRVAAIGVNFEETLWRRNQYFESPVLPAGLGYDASGTIDKLGPGVTGFAVGDKVATFPAHSQGDYPAYGEWAIMPAMSVAHYPAKLSDVEAASYWTAYLTGYFALIEIAKLASGQTVLITAASSSTGLAAIEIAKSVVRVSSQQLGHRKRSKLFGTRERISSSQPKKKILWRAFLLRLEAKASTWLTMQSAGSSLLSLDASSNREVICFRTASGGTRTCQRRSTICGSNRSNFICT